MTSKEAVWLCAKLLGLVYTERERQRGENSAITLVILLSLKTMESLENGFAIPLFSMRAVFLFNESSISFQ